MNVKASKSGVIFALLLLSLCPIAWSLAQNQSQEDRKQEIKSRIDCVLCKILNLITLIAIPLTLIVVVPLLLMGIAASIISRDKWKKAQTGTKEKRKAKWIMTISIAFTALMVSAILLTAILLLFAATGDGCRSVCRLSVGWPTA